MRFCDSRYNRHNAPVRLVRKSCSYIKHFNLFLFVPGYSAMRHAKPGLLLDILQRTMSWRRFLWWRSWLVKNLSTLMGYRTILYWWEPHPIWLYCWGKTHQGGILWMLNLSIQNKSVHQAPVTGHQSPVIHYQIHQAPVTRHPGMDKITGHSLPVTGHWSSSHRASRQG